MRLTDNWRRCYTRQFFVQRVSQRLKAYHYSCTNRGATLCSGTFYNKKSVSSFLIGSLPLSIRVQTHGS